MAETERRTAVKIHRGRSADVASKFPNRYFDMLYLDADHHYDAVLADLVAYAPKLKTGGIIMGDDFLEDFSHTDGLYGTIDAVNTFIKRTDFKCLAILGPYECQYLLYREMSSYVDRFISALLDEKLPIIEINDALLPRFAQRIIRTSIKQRRVPSFI